MFGYYFTFISFDEFLKSLWQTFTPPLYKIHCQSPSVYARVFDIHPYHPIVVRECYALIVNQ